MKRVLLSVLVIACVASVASVIFAAPPARRKSSRTAKIPEPEVLRDIRVDDIKPGMRVRLQLHYGKPLVGTVLRVTGTRLRLDLSGEATGLPGKFRFRKSDVALAYELKKQTDEEKQQVLERRKEKVSRIRIKMEERLEKRKAGEKQAEQEEAAEETTKKALDVIVKKEEEAEMRVLLKEFPADEWGEEKLREIRETWILRDLAPNAKESRFVTVFKEWENARDTVAVLDARKRREEGGKLLLRFPPSEGWGQERLAKIIRKETKGEAVAGEEAEFRKSYEAWSEALSRRAAEKQSETPAEQKTTVQTVKPTEEQKPAETE